MSTSTSNNNENNLKEHTFSPSELVIKNCNLVIRPTGRIGTDTDFEKVTYSEGVLEITGKSKGFGISVSSSGNCVTTIGNNMTFSNISFGNGNVMWGSGDVYINGKRVDLSKLEKEDDKEEVKEPKEVYFLDKATISKISMGSGELRIDEKFIDKSRLSVDVDGSGSVVLPESKEYGVLILRLNGSGDIELTDSKCQEVQAAITGSGDIDLNNTTAKRAYLTISGSGDISDLIVSSGGSVSLYGSGDIKVYKTSDDVTINESKSGSGKIRVRKIQ